jgi:hypothetical protein
VSDGLERVARALAYRWYRVRHLEAAHGEAWAFALAHWTNFLDEAARRTDDRPADAAVAVDTDGCSG